MTPSVHYILTKIKQRIRKAFEFRENRIPPNQPIKEYRLRSGKEHE